MEGETTVTNVCVKNIRPEYNDLAEWMNDTNNVYVGRRGVVFINKERFPKHDSKWSNPYKISKTDSRESVIAKYKVYIIKKIKDENLENELLKLEGKKLGCWCYPSACHADVLVELINEVKKSMKQKKTK